MFMDRTERQKLGVQKWIDNRLRGTLEYATGVGKSYTAMMAIQRFLAKNPNASVLIVVPTDLLKEQWLEYLVKYKVLDNCKVLVINTVVKGNYACDMLVIDEIHKTGSDTFSRIFRCVKYQIILGLTATLERLDGKQKIIEKFCPVVDTITISEALLNDWLSPYREYKVLLEVDLTEYLETNRQFYEYFSFFNNDFQLAMSCATDWKARNNLCSKMYTGDDKIKRSAINKQILVNAMGFSRTLQKRKAFIYNQPKKVEIANLILQHRSDKKCITFSNTIAMAEKIKYGKVYSGKDSKKKGRTTIEEFSKEETGVLNTSKKCDEGMDIPGLSVAIMLGIDSSKTRKTQRVGRVIRRAENKEAEVFTLVLKGTVEEEWFRKSTEGKDYITINEENLLHLLKGEEFETQKNREVRMILRF
mgnify:CR=1 FL=1